MRLAAVLCPVACDEPNWCHANSLAAHAESEACGKLDYSDVRYVPHMTLVAGSGLHAQWVSMGPHGGSPWAGCET